jgi:protein AroM
MPLTAPNSGSCAEIEFAGVIAFECESKKRSAGSQVPGDIPRSDWRRCRTGGLLQTLRVLVTGQSPRPDVEAQVALEAPGIEFRLSGALDGMSRADINGSTWRCSDADILPAKLASGEISSAARGLVADRLSASLQTRGPTLLWSTTSFLTLPRYDDVVRPADLLTAMIDVLLPAGTLGLIVPSRQQLERKIKERTRPGVRVVAATVAPQSDSAAIDDAAYRLLLEKPDLALLDCMSYTRSDLARVSAILPCLVVLPAAVAVRAAAALFSDYPGASRA